MSHRSKCHFRVKLHCICNIFCQRTKAVCTGNAVTAVHWHSDQNPNKAKTFPRRDNQCKIFRKISIFSPFYSSFVLMIRFITNRNYIFCCSYQVKLSPDNHYPNSMDLYWPCTVIKWSWMAGGLYIYLTTNHTRRDLSSFQMII